MPSYDRVSPKNRRLVLAQLSRDRLAQLTERLELEVSDRRSIEAHVDAIVRKRSLEFRSVLELLQRDELTAACGALGRDTAGRDKATLIQRILGEPASTSNDATAAAATTHNAETASTKTTESSVPPPDSARSLGTVKSALRRFVLDTAGGYRGRDAAAMFTARLLECFGWPSEGPPGTSMPTAVNVVDNAQRGTRQVALSWPERGVLVEVVQHDVMLDYAWKELLRVCLQVNPAPQYVVLTNQRDLQLYDLARDREQPRLSIPVDDLPKHSEAFPFLSAQWVPGTTPKIIDSLKVSREVAELVARLYRSLKEQHPKRDRDVVQFTLQCILTMFAEDIGLLPKEYFTSLLYEGAKKRDVETRLRDMFEVMSTRDLPARVVPYFNGGLFTNAVTLPLGDEQQQALIKASEANWKYVDPHIFGSVFQGIMDAGDRHKHGVHYTAHEDIMRVVVPTIVDPWRQRIRSAKTLAELFETRTALLKFRVLDPACGSGNFLYVAFRELYRLDTELLARMMREFPSTQGEGRNKMTWGAGIQTSSFFGIDINPFAVELAKVTLNIAKKIAFEERREFAADVEAQVELDVDPSLPLDNLDKNIVCADALFSGWPPTDAILGNPPFLGEKWMRKELGSSYLEQLRRRYPGVTGDFCVYWYRRAHDHLSLGSRAGLIATSGIRAGNNRAAALDYIVENGATITNAVSEREWPGEANIHVSMVNWNKGPCAGPHQLVIGDDVFEVPVIATHLQLHRDVSGAKELAANRSGTCQGVTFGTQMFYVDAATAARLRRDPLAAPHVQAVANGDDVLGGTLERGPDQAVHLGRFAEEADARKTGAAFEYVQEHVKPFVEGKAKKATTDHYKNWLRTWWRPFWHRRDFLDRTERRARIIACSRVASRPIFFFLSTKLIAVEQLQLFAFDDDYTYGVLQSSLHWQWAVVKGGRREERIRYSTEVWRTFPWPQEPNEGHVAAVGLAAQQLRDLRLRLMRENRWTLRELHQVASATVTHPLRVAQDDLDNAVREAYGMPHEQESTEFLLDLNRLLAEDEADGRSIQGPGLPQRLDPVDPRWMSADCIEPPPTTQRTDG